MSGLLKDWSILLGSNVIQHGFTAITYLYLARIFKPEEYGLFSVILTAVTIAQLIASLGMNRIVTREIAAHPASAGEIIKNFRACLSSAASLTAVFVIIYLFYFESVTDVTLLTVICLLFLVNTGWNYFESIAFGYSQFRLVGIAGAVFAVLIFTAVFFVIHDSSQLPLVIIIMGASGFIKLLTMNFFLTRLAEREPSVKREGFSLISSSLPLYGTVLLSLPIIQMPVLFLSQFSGKAEVGYFAVISKFTVPITLLIHNLNTIILPKLSNKYASDREGFKQMTRNLFLLIALGGMLLSFVSGTFSREMVLLFLGESYDPAALPLALQFWITLNMMFHSFIGTVMVAAGKEKLMVKLSVFNAVVVGSLILAGSFYGALGMSLAMWGGYLAGIVVHLYFLNSNVEQFVSFKLVFLILLLFTGGTFAVYSVTYQEVWVKILLGAALSVIAFLVFRYALPEQKRREVRDIVLMVRNG
ncbi:MAG: hypothetical protein AMXMBFR48_11830 [Ignavibacteriales bacterium]